MHFRIFIPANRPPTSSPQPLIDVGLAHLTTNFMAVPERIEGVPGSLYFWPRPGDQQALPPGVPFQWTPAKAFDGLPAGRYRVGLNPDHLPTPKELAVPMQVQGDALALGDTLAAWIIPDILFLPANVLLDGDAVKFERLCRYQSRTIECGRWVKECEAFTQMVKEGKASGEFSIEWRRAYELALMSLQINYRLPVEVVEALNLFTTDRLKSILFASIGAYELARAADAQEPKPLLV